VNVGVEFSGTGVITVVGSGSVVVSSQPAPHRSLYKDRHEVLHRVARPAVELGANTVLDQLRRHVIELVSQLRPNAFDLELLANVIGAVVHRTRFHLSETRMEM
jgi:hypothetical protein